MACLHDHSCEDHNCAADWSLYNHIDVPKVRSLSLRHPSHPFSSVARSVVALNESVPGSVKSVFKPWERRLDTSGGFLESNEGDPELLIFIPFTSDVKIKSISVVGGADGTSPSRMRAFINREGIDFSDAQNMQPVQEWELAENLQGVLEYQTRYSRFQGVANLTLHFSDNFGGDTTKIYYIGLRGEATQNKRDVVATIVYEVMPNPSDHKTKSETGGGFSHVE
ncbi:hypothetical protein U9M48_018752 [Paspalum notatum var. saurae]|uniref:PITH domain-containing protein n=1 Tax=Paspalum notatum var. saurae TaxID=547442 RepID=A0AAQ3TBA4_PASNO